MRALLLVGSVLTVAIGVFQLLAGDRSGALWTLGGVALGMFTRWAGRS